MKKLIGMAMVALLAIACNTALPQQQIKEEARRSSVMPLFVTPYLIVQRVVEEEQEPDLDSVIEEKVKELLEKERDLQKEIEDRSKKDYRSYLTTITVYGHEPKSRTQIPIGSLSGVPSWAKFPERVLVVYKVETTKINEWDEEFDADVLTISETANVSPANAKAILSKLRSEGYSVSKDEVSVDEEIELLHFSGGWDDEYPTTLRWSVKVSNTDENLIVGYDPRGILETKPIPEEKRVDVEVSYFDLEEYSKPKPVELEAKDAEIESLKDQIKNLQDQMADMVDIPEEEYDITKATIFDLMSGRVTLEEGWMLGGGSGVYLGEMKMPGNENEYAMHNRYYGVHYAQTEMSSVILTNAHVAINGIQGELIVSADKETMWVILPGIPYVRYTHNSGKLGTPAAVLFLDGEPMLSHEVDAGILVTTPIPGLKPHKAVLGNSDNIKDGIKVVSVGNPGMLHKFVTEGIISNKNYNLYQSPIADYLSGGHYNATVNDSLWIDTTIGMGGVSGSPVLPLEGVEKGNVIGLRNAGLNMRYADYVTSDTNPVDHNLIRASYDRKICNLDYESIRDVFSSYEDAKYTRSVDDIDGFVEAVKHSGGYVPIAGMNLCIPINAIKAWMVERGMDLQGIKMNSEYWVN